MRNSSDYQTITYKINSQPYFVVLNSENEVIDTGDFLTLGNRLDCMEFMSKSLKVFHE